MYYDVLNALAMLGVVFMHFNGIVHMYAPSIEGPWRQSLVVECVFYWAVPIFFMISGATLMGYRERYDTATFFKKRALRVVVPWLAWSVICLVWKVATAQMEPPMGPRTFVNMLLNNQIEVVYWFFLPLFSIYLCMPLLSLLADPARARRNERVMWYAVGVTFVLVSLLPCLCRSVGIRWNPDLGFPMLAGYLIFPVLGYLLSRTEFTRAQRWAIYALGLFGLALRFIGTLVLTDAGGKLDERLWEYTNFPCVLLSVAVFVAAKNIPWDRLFRTARARRGLANVAGASFGIYLVHMIVFWGFQQVTHLPETSPVWRWAMPLLAYAVCLAIVLVLKRVPGVRRILP
ncbi:MAG: acyltransferase [Coriobacteriales bacterium]